MVSRYMARRALARAPLSPDWISRFTRPVTRYTKSGRRRNSSSEEDEEDVDINGDKINTERSGDLQDRDPAANLRATIVAKDPIEAYAPTSPLTKTEDSLKVLNSTATLIETKQSTIDAPASTIPVMSEPSASITETRETKKRALDDDDSEIGATSGGAEKKIITE